MPLLVDLIVEVPAQPAHIFSDATQLQQVVLNMVLNARDAMPDGGELTLHVAREYTEPDYPRALLQVSEMGTGITAKNQSRIFEPFFTTKAPGKGTGLGLSMVKQIVDEHEGDIELHSEIGRGSRFTISFPALPEVAPAPSPDPPPRLTRDHGGEVVLLAEDDSQVRGILAGELETLGCVVIQAKDGHNSSSVTIPIGIRLNSCSLTSACRIKVGWIACGL